MGTTALDDSKLSDPRIESFLQTRAVTLQFRSCVKMLFYNPLKQCSAYTPMEEREYKEKVKKDDDEQKVEREYKDEFGNKVKEKHEVKLD